MIIYDIYNCVRGLEWYLSELATVRLPRVLRWTAGPVKFFHSPMFLAGCVFHSRKLLQIIDIEKGVLSVWLDNYVTHVCKALFMATSLQLFVSVLSMEQMEHHEQPGCPYFLATTWKSTVLRTGRSFTTTATNKPWRSFRVLISFVLNSKSLDFKFRAMPTTQTMDRTFTFVLFHMGSYLKKQCHDVFGFLFYN